VIDPSVERIVGGMVEWIIEWTTGAARATETV